MVRIIVPDTLMPQLAERLASSEAPVELVAVGRDGHGAVEQADAVLRWDLSDAGLRRVLDQAPRLRWLHSASAGVETLPLDELRRQQITITNAAGVFAIPIAEWVITAMLMVVKQVHAMHDAQREHRWGSDLRLGELAGKTLLILGLGGIGREVARRAAGFDLRVWGTNRSGRQVEHVERVISGDEWRGALPEADFVVVTLPLTPATRSLVGAAELAMVKPGAWLINIGRGAVIDEAAMIEALRQGPLGGAAIDAWVEEPLPPDHPAWSLQNMIVWPHRSGDSPVNERRGLDLFVDNVRRFVSGQALRNVVDLEQGY